MPGRFTWIKQVSTNNQSNANDDISQVNVSSSQQQKNILSELNVHVKQFNLQNQESNNKILHHVTKSETCNLENETVNYSNQQPILKRPSCDLFVDEISIHIAEYLDLKSLNSFARVDSSLLKLIFNREKNETKLINYQLDENSDFLRIQEIIWKPLVFRYFPNFGKSLNVKNWMLVLHKRLKHIKLYNQPNSYQIPMPSFAKTAEQQQFIENCEWIYKCPLSYKSLKPSPLLDAAYCKVCNREVQMVHDMVEMKWNLMKGNCVAYSPKPLRPVMMGYIVPPGGLIPPPLPPLPPTGGDIKEIQSKTNEFEKDEVLDFGRIQNLIWKPLVFYYFPKFGEKLNVKNYLHVLRRRIQYIKIGKPQNTIIATPQFSKTIEDQQYIENCTWIYKCPLKYETLNTVFSQ